MENTAETPRDPPGDPPPRPRLVVAADALGCVLILVLVPIFTYGGMVGGALLAWHLAEMAWILGAMAGIPVGIAAGFGTAVWLANFFRRRP